MHGHSSDFSLEPGFIWTCPPPGLIFTCVCATGVYSQEYLGKVIFVVVIQIAVTMKSSLFGAEVNGLFIKVKSSNQGRVTVPCDSHTARRASQPFLRFVHPNHWWKYFKHAPALLTLSEITGKMPIIFGGSGL